MGGVGLASTVGLVFYGIWLKKRVEATEKETGQFKAVSP